MRKLLLLALIPLLIAADSSVDMEAKSIFGEVMSPYCPGRTLINCPSSSARELKEEIREKLAAGTSRADLTNELYARFGDEIRAAPKTEGFGLVAWIAPPLFLLLGAFLTIGWLIRQKSKVESPTSEEEDEHQI